MPHVLYATLALALLGLASLGQHQSERHEQTRAVGSQVDAAAQTVGTSLHEALALLPFDAVATTDTTALTPAALFGPDLPTHSYSDADDLDDVHGITETIVRTLTDPATGSLREIPFSVRAQVQYVRSDAGALASAGSGRTLTKEVTVTVSHAALSSPLRLVRVYSP